MTAMQHSLNNIIHEASQIILGKEQQLRLALTCFLAQGHLLIEDFPGMGKTTLAQVLAHILGLSFQRIQFTSDLLPADILGVSIYDTNRNNFVFHAGPIFSQLILADEVNRATPKTQSALLEAMEEHQVTIESETRLLPAPFFVVATQNPSHQIGTFPLPESQLDRFLMCIEMNYPSPEAERMLLKGGNRREMLQSIKASLTLNEINQLRTQVPLIHVSEPLLDYLQSIIHFSRHAPLFVHGLSPRAGVALLRSAQAWALLAGRQYVMPEDVQTVLPAVINHRLRFAAGGENGKMVASAAEQIIVAIPV